VDRIIEGALAPSRALAGKVRASGVWFAYGLLAVLLLNFVQYRGHDLQRILELLYLGAAGLALAWFAPRMNITARVGRPAVLALAVFFGAGVISSTVALSPVRSAYEVGSMLLVLLVGLAAADALARHPAALTRVLQIFSAIAALYALRIMAVVASVWISQLAPVTRDFTPGFNNFRHFNHVETIGLPLLALAYQLTARGARLRSLWMATAIMWWAILFLDAGRGTMVGLAAGCVAVVIARGRSALPLLRTMLLAASAGAAVYWVFFVLAPKAAGMLPFGELPYMIERSVTDPASGRTFLWKLALSLIESHPWLGVGPIHFAHFAAPLHVGAHPHNWALQIAAEWGLPALAAMCVALVLAVRSVLATGARIQQGDSANHDMLAAWVLAGAALMVDGMVSGSLVMPQIQLMIALYIALVAGWTWSRIPQAPLPGAQWQGRLLSVVALLAVAAMAWGTAPQFADKLADRPETPAEAKANGTEYAWPRQWMWGYF
jgi:putative inorganic carbon (hco3(-)) transporter